jgi:hypothetical protein
MLPLVDQRIPRNVKAFQDALTAAVHELFEFPKGRHPVHMDGEFPQIGALRIDLSGASIEMDRQPPMPRPIGKAKRGPTARSFELSGHPIHFQNARLELDLNAKNVAFEYGRDRSDHLLLLIKEAKDGHLQAQISRDDLEHVLLEAARMAAADRGISIQDVRLDLKQDARKRGAIEASVEVTAKKFVSAVIEITGRLEIDDELNVRLSNLVCAGHGMIGGLVCGFVRPQLDRLESRKFPLMGFSLGEIRLHDLDVRIDRDVLRVRAAFGD